MIAVDQKTGRAWGIKGPVLPGTTCSICSGGKVACGTVNYAASRNAVSCKKQAER